MTEHNNLYDFDYIHTDVKFDAVSPAGNTHPVYHRLRKPTIEQLNIREQQIKYEMIGVTSRKEQIRSDDTLANVNLWNKLIMAVKGYEKSDDWRELSDEEKAGFNPDHKVTAIATLYAGSCEVEGDADYIPIGPVDWTVRQNIGLKQDAPDFVVRHFLREPTEAERIKFKRSATTTCYIKGAKQTQMEVETKLGPHVELYNALIQRIEGGKAGNSDWESLAESESLKKLLINSIDPMWKRLVIQCLMQALSGQLSD